MKLLSLTSDFVFRALFTRSPNSLIDLINSALEFKGNQKIKSLELLPTEIPKDHFKDKLAVLDIKAQSLAGEIFNIEMQAFEQNFYSARALYYWAKLYSGQLRQGQEYKELKNTYSINFLNFKLIELSEYKSHFLILEKDHPHIQLTDKCQIVFFELPKFEKALQKIDDNLGLWLYMIKNTSFLDDEKMRVIVDKNPVMEETLGELKKISIDPKLLSLEEARRKAELDYNSRLGDKFRAGKAEGIEEGIEKGIEEGIEKGREEERIQVALNLLKKGISIDIISETTGLSPEQIKSL